MKVERDQLEQKAEEDFKSLLVAGNPELYHKLYIEKPFEEEEIEQFVPSNPREVADALASLRASGIAVDLDPTDNDFSKFKFIPPSAPKSTKTHSDDTEPETGPHTLLDNQDIE